MRRVKHAPSNHGGFCPGCQDDDIACLKYFSGAFKGEIGQLIVCSGIIGNIAMERRVKNVCKCKAQSPQSDNTHLPAMEISCIYSLRSLELQDEHESKLCHCLMGIRFDFFHFH